MNVIIFGSGRAAQHVWDLLEGVDWLSVIAFADNDVQRQGTRVQGVAVWSAAQMAAAAGTPTVVVASQWHAEILAQLVALGVAPARVIVWGGEEAPLLDSLRQRVMCLPAAAGGAPIDRAALPRVLVLSCETLNDTHGTGVLLRRYFEDFPRSHLFSIAHRAHGAPWLAQSLHVDVDTPGAADRIRAALAHARFVPDLVFATALHESDLALLDAVLHVVPASTPVVQHFMDCVPRNSSAFLDGLRTVGPRLTEVWALTEPLQALAAAALDRQVPLVTGLLQRAPAQPRVSHQPFGPGFRTAMVGNFYHPDVVAFLREVWVRCRAARPGLGPIEWYVAPGRLQSLLDQGVDPGLDVVWRGFFSGPRLLRRLAAADMGLLALNADDRASTDYLRYSLPSRLAEFACAGVPLFAVASPDTPLARYVDRHGIGRVATGPDPARVAEALVSFIDDVAGRAAAGLAGRALATSAFDVDRFRDWFNGRMVAIAARPIASERVS